LLFEKRKAKFLKPIWQLGDNQQQKVFYIISTPNFSLIAFFPAFIISNPLFISSSPLRNLLSVVIGLLIFRYLIFACFFIHKII